jgi:hypothetical protein
MIKKRIYGICGTIIAFVLILAALSPTIVEATDGDNPLTTFLEWEGKVGVVVDIYPQPGNKNPFGDFNISGIPNGSNIIYASLYITSWEQYPHSISTEFAGNDLGVISQFANDSCPGSPWKSTYNLCAWQWDVTSIISGNGIYPFTTSNVSWHYGSALVVIYGNPIEPVRQIIINHGAEALYSSTSSTVFNGVVEGKGTLILFTQADDYTGTNESISFNGVIILGPGNVFNNTSGYYASLICLPVNTTQGTNTACITTDVDFFGWHLAILQAESVPSKVTSTNDIDPDTLNLKSKGRWITCYIDLPTGYDVNYINISTIMLEDTIPVEWDDIQGNTLMVKFDRSEVEDMLSPGTYNLKVTGEFTDGTKFEGFSDEIRVIDPP